MRTWLFTVLVVTFCLLNVGCSDTVDDDGSSSPVPTHDPDDTPDASPEDTPGDSPTSNPGTDTPSNDDLDGDGYSEAEGDCDDGDETSYPGAEEVPYDGIDQDCDDVDVTDVDEDGYDSDQVQDGTDCDDQNPNTYPGASEYADGEDNDCDGVADNDLDSSDDDGDGSAESDGDCDDQDDQIFPGQSETCNGIDDDCDGAADDADSEVTGQNTFHLDADQDTYGDPLTTVLTCESEAPFDTVADGSDCDDSSPDVHPGAAEVCNGIDDDCDDRTDDADDQVTGQTTYYIDEDGDQYGSPLGTASSCAGVAPSGYAATDTDCADGDASINPGAQELCNSIDDDCDTQVDDDDSSISGQNTYFADSDGDGYGDPSSAFSTCAPNPPSGYVSGSSDCDDADSATNPAATELCNDIDDDCDSLVDDADTGVSGQNTYYQDADGDGYGTGSSTTSSCASAPPSGYASDTSDCNDASASIHPGAAEVCDNADVDEDCDGLADNADPSVTGQTTYYGDSDSDGYGSPEFSQKSCVPLSGYVTNSDDCDDGSPSINPDGTEACNGSDDDCDGLTDDEDDGEILYQNTYYLDADGDGYGGSSSTVDTCAPLAPDGYAATDDDCNDASASISPEATEVCDDVDVDEDCDGAADDGDLSTAGQNPYYGDFDGDGYGNASLIKKSCASTPPAGYVTSPTDCDDSKSSVYPGAYDLIGDGIDSNCNGKQDIISTFAGNGTTTATDGGAATSSGINGPAATCLDAGGNLYIAEYGNHRVRKVTPSGTISTVAGTGSAGSTGDGGAATAAKIYNPYGIACTAAGELYIAESTGCRIRKVTTGGTISTLAGNGTCSSTGDGSAATAATVFYPNGMVFDASGNLYFAEYGGHKVRRIAASDGKISTVAGTGVSGSTGDGLAATAARLNGPTSVAFDSSGNYYIAEASGHRVRKVTTDGKIATVAGTGTQGSTGDGGAATSARLNTPAGLAVDNGNNLLISELNGYRVRRVNTGGTISTVIGTGSPSFSGDGGAATAATIFNPKMFALDSLGGFYLADSGNHRIRKVSP